MNNYIEHETTFFDDIENIFVKAVLLLRGSKKLFSNENAARKYLEKVKNEVYIFSPGKNLKSSVSRKKLLETEYAVFEPNGNQKPKTAVFYLHGGAYVRHITRHHLKFIDRLCTESKARFIVPAYLTAPKYGFLESVGQLAEIYKKETESFERVVIAGDSCGGAIGVCLLKHLSENGAKFPQTLLLFSPLLNHEISGHEETERLSSDDPMFGGTKGLSLFIDCWSNGNTASNPIEADISALPKTYIFTSKGDMLSAGCLDFFEKAKALGFDITLEIWNKMFHDFVLYPLPSSKKLLKKAAEIIEK